MRTDRGCNLTVKKIPFLFLVFLVSCQLTPSRITGNPFVPQLEGFDFGQSCPHGCWLGMNPGITKVDKAKAILQASNQIDKSQYLIYPDGIITSWRPENLKNAICTVGVHFEKGVVDTLYLTNVPYTVNDFVRTMGQPDIIRIKVQRAIVDSVAYAIYFSSRKVMVEVLYADWTGPAPNDRGTVLLNVKPDLPTSPVDWGESQPWLGYGHIRDYLPGVEIPTQGATPNPSQGEIPIP
jgi:hypothetical protein